MLFNLQLLRGFAALGVVFYHTDFRLAGDWHTDFSGVAIFFVISGFIMCFITRDDADGFLAKRFIRIVPTEFFLDIASSQISCFSNDGATLPYDEGGVYRAFRISTTA